MKPARSTAGVLVAGAVALAAVVAAGDVRLWQVFSTEHEDALARIGSEQHLIEEAGRAVLVDEFARRVDAGRVERDRMLNDALADDHGLVLVVDGRQLLPHVVDQSPARAPTADAQNYRDIAAGKELFWSPGSDTVGAMYEAMMRVRRAQRGAPDELTSAVRDYLERRANTRISGSIDAVFTMFVAQALLDRGDADPLLVRELLADGRDVGGLHIAPLQGELLRARAWLADDDAEFLRARLLELCDRAGVDHAVFDEKWRAVADPPLAVPARAYDEPVVLPGFVYLRPYDGAPRTIEGVRVPEAEARALVDRDLRTRKLLLDGESVSLVPGDDRELVRATLHAPRLDAARRQADRLLLLERALLAVTSAMAGAVVAAAVVEVARRRRFDALRSSFVAAVSHELRTPLASMRLLVDSLHAGAADERSGERLERLGRDVDGLEFLVENILSFSRLERGKLVPAKTRCWLGEIVSDAVERCRGEAVSTAITADVVEDCAVDVDPELVGLVVANLVRNAWQHNPRRTRQGATVRVLVDGGRVTVVDDGPGIPEADRARIFAEFERGSRPASRGTGLGLALCRQIAKAHGGDVVLASTGPAGSTFALELPIAAA